MLVGLEKGPEFLKLEAMGHEVVEYCYPWGEGEEDPALHLYDLILGPKCWRILPQHLKFLELALKEARTAVKATKPKKVKAASHA